MISMPTFQDGLELLLDHFNRPLSLAVQAIWKEYLDKELSDAEFAEAVKHAVLHCQFFPTAGQLVEFIKSSKEVRAIQEWQIVLQASANPQDLDGIAYLSQRGRVALRAIGGLYKVGMAKEFQRQRMERNFITCYCQVSDRDSKCLPPTSSEAASNLTEASEDSAPVPESVKEQIEALKAKLSMNGSSKRRTGNA